MIIENENFCKMCFDKIADGQEICSKCDNKSNNELYPTVLEEGTVVGEKYVIGKVLGKGGFGITYLAYDCAGKKKVAIKEYFPDSLAHRDTGLTTLSLYTDGRYDDFKKGEESFYNEAKTLSLLSYNNNIVKVFEMFSENNTSYYVMEYLEGSDLKKHLMKNGPMPEKEVLSIMEHVMDAVSAVHSLDFLHRDISPDNIFLCKDGSVKLIDFGSARQVISQEAKTLTVMLKHGFAPFEQYKTHGVQGPWTDIYALGATIYYAITGKVPLDAPSRIDKPDLDMTNVSENLSWVLKGMLNIQPEYRFRSIKEVRDAMANSQNQAQQSIPPVQNVHTNAAGYSQSTGNNVTGNVPYSQQGAAMGNMPTSAFNPTSGNTTNSYNYAPSQKPPKKPKDKKKTKKIALICVGVFLGLIVAVTGISIASDPLSFRKFLLSSEYDHVGNFYDGYALVQKDFKYGFVDENGDVVVEPIYDYATSFEGGYASVEKDDKWGFIDTKGNVVIPLEYEGSSTATDYFQVEKDGFWGGIDLKGETVVPFRYTQSYNLPYELADLRKLNPSYEAVFTSNGIEEIDHKVYDDYNNTAVDVSEEGSIETMTYVYNGDTVVEYIDTLYVIKDKYPALSSSDIMEVLEETAKDYEGLSACTVNYYNKDEYCALSIRFEGLDSPANVAQMGDLVDGNASKVSKEKTEEGFINQGYVLKYIKADS